jgi:transcriptional regulator with XRE-family HTH domain
MSKTARKGPARLAGKLKQIRESLGLSQSEMVKRLEAEDIINRTHIANYERGEREPTLPVLLKYSRVANIYLEVLVDDELNLPDKLPGEEKSIGKELLI